MPRPADALPHPEQDRSARRRARLLEAAIRLMLQEGASAVTHRRAAQEAESSPSSVRYYFRTREDLLVAAWAELEARRVETARRLLEEAERTPPRDGLAAARLLLEVYYGPALDDASLVGDIRCVAECSRESPRLAGMLAELRQASQEQLEQAMAVCGLHGIPAGLVCTVIDGSVFTSAIQGASRVAEAAAQDLSAILALAGTGTRAETS